MACPFIVLSSFLSDFHPHKIADAPKRFRFSFGIVGALFVGTLFAISSMYAQTGPAPTLADELGFTPYQSYHGGDVDSVNLSNGRVMIHAPLISYPQRGGLLKQSFSLGNGSNALQVQEDCSVPPDCLFHWNVGTLKSQTGSVSAAVAIIDDQSLSGGVVQVKGNILPGGYHNYYYYGRISASDGTSHLVGQTSGVWETINTNLTNSTFRTIDGTGYTSSVDSVGNWTMTDSMGIKYYQGGAAGTQPPTVWKEDPNGNQITRTTGGLIDTLGRNIPYTTTTVDSTSCPQGGTLLPISSAYLWTLPGLNGGTFQIKFCNALVTVNIPNLTLSDNFVYNYPISPHGISTLQSVVFPANNTAWSFEYNDVDGTNYKNLPVNYGSLTKVTMPGGGTISYAYSTISGGYDLGSRWVASRTVNANDGTGAHTWTYSYNPNFPVTTTVTDPLLSDTVHSFTATGGGSEFETQTQYFQGPKASNVVLKTVATQYTYTVDYGAGASFAAFPTTITTTWPNGQTSRTTKTYDSGFSFYNAAQNSTGTYGRVTLVAESDYGSTFPTLRYTASNYMFQSNSNYLNNNMLNLVSNFKVSDGNANQMSYVYFGYDENNPLVSSGVTMQHDSSPPAGIYRGNQTSAHRWLNGSTVATTNCNVSVSNGYLSSSKAYYDTGEVQKTTDPCGYATTYQYSSTYYGAYVTQATNALNQSTNSVFDFNTGVVTSVTDANSQTTSKQYDAMIRPTQVSYPDGGSTSYCYTDLGGPKCTQSGPPYEVVITKAITSSMNETSTLVFDGLGRVSQTQLNSDPDGVDYVDTTCDADGRKATVSNPHRSASSTTDGTISYVYDGLGRVCAMVPPDGTAVAGACPASAPAKDAFTSYSGNCTAVTDEAGKSRKSCIDGLGRMTGVWEDPSGLSYETDYQYDALNNLTSVTQKGSNSANAEFSI
jgi:RHS Repeat